MDFDLNKHNEELGKLDSDAKKIDYLQGTINKLNESLTFHIGEKKSIIEKRDELKSKMSELEKQVADGKVSGDLLTAKNKEIETLSSQLEELKSKNLIMQKTVSDIETSTRNELLESVPDEEIRKSLSLITDVNLLREQVKLWRQKLDITGSFNSKNTKVSFETKDKKYEDLTSDELYELESKDKSLYNRLRADFNKRKGQ